MNRILLLLLVLYCLLSACSKEQEEEKKEPNKYGKGFIGTWVYEGYQLLPYDKHNVNTLSILTINNDGTFTFKGESMFVPFEEDSSYKPRIVDDNGTWSFDDNKGILSLTKKVVWSSGYTKEMKFDYKVLYPDNRMIFYDWVHNFTTGDYKWYFTKK